jgi:histidinol phosphatase-like PHP family hydrolase
MTSHLTRRDFARVAATLAAAPAAAFSRGLDFPLVDYHVHIEREMTIERALKIAAERGVKIGVAEHGGCAEAMRDDAGLRRYIERLSPYPVYKGMQAEGLDWARCFSKEATAELDFVLSDALTFPEKDGRRVRLWTKEAKVEDKQDFMERYVDFNVRVISTEPIDIFANPTFLPEAIAAEYDTLWTGGRMKRVIDAAVEHEVAIEINALYRIPSLAFLRAAKDAGVKFSFGSNTHGEGIGKLHYCLEMAKALGLSGKHMFSPAPRERKPVMRRAAG